MSPVPRAGFTAVNGRETSPPAPKPNGSPTSPSEGQPYPLEPRPLSPAKRKRDDDDADTGGPRRRLGPDAPVPEPDEHDTNDHPEPGSVDPDDGPDDDALDAQRHTDQADVTTKKPRKRAYATRTKTGCQTCRRRKKKCDEKKPECNNCIRGGFVCEGYLVRSTWPRPGLPNHYSLQSKQDYPGYLGLYLRHPHEPSPEYRPQQALNGTRAAEIAEEERNLTSSQSTWRLTPQEAVRPPLAQPLALSNEPFRASRPLEPALNARLDIINPVRTDQPTSSRPITSNHETHGIEKTQSAVAPHLPLYNPFLNTQPAQLTPTVLLPPLAQLTQSVPLTQPAQPPQPIPQAPLPQPPQTTSTERTPLPTRTAQPSQTVPVTQTEQPTQMTPPGQLEPPAQPAFTLLQPQPPEEKEVMVNALRDFNNVETAWFNQEEKTRLLRVVLDPPSTRAPDAPVRGYLGRNVCVETPFNCQYGYNLSIGDDTRIGEHCTIIDPVAVTIGARCMIGRHVDIYGTTASTIMPDEKVHGCTVRIEDDVAVGGWAAIMPGVTIGRGSTVAPGSVVTKDVEPHSIVEGDPARVIRPYWYDLWEEDDRAEPTPARASTMEGEEGL